ncbi:MAG: hypothetical protein IKO96_03905 [Spirochaetales bacterium]|nr:hypothetical protein [Spirochaetales bacterium]
MVCFILYLAQGVMTASEYWTCFTSGIKNMLNSLLLMVLAFLFAKVNAAIGFTYYMIQIAESFMTPHFLPRQSQCSCTWQRDSSSKIRCFCRARSSRVLSEHP